jgi:hypothetical protein
MRGAAGALSAGWLFVNVVAPLCLPILGMIALKLLPLAPVAPAGSLRLMTIVKDGQLCWGVIGMSAAAIYEAHSHAQMPAWSDYPFAIIITLLVPASILAAGGSVFTTVLSTAAPTSGISGWIQHYRVFVGSLAMSAAAALCYTLLHVTAGAS